MPRPTINKVRPIFSIISATDLPSTNADTLAPNRAPSVARTITFNRGVMDLSFGSFRSAAMLTVTNDESVGISDDRTALSERLSGLTL